MLVNDMSNSGKYSRQKIINRGFKAKNRIPKKMKYCKCLAFNPNDNHLHKSTAKLPLGSVEFSWEEQQ